MSEKTYEILDLESVFLPTVDTPTKRLVGTASKPLTAAGENYGSIMLALDVTLEDTATGETETIQTVAKLVPKNEFIQKIFQPEMTFPKEIQLYRKLVPIMQEFQRKHGVEEVVDFAPKFYGGRAGLKKDQFDVNACLILENLKKRGFVNLDRRVGFDLESAKFVLRDVAKLHAISIAIKAQDPKLFETEFLPFLGVLQNSSEFTLDDLLGNLKKIIEENPECAPYWERCKKTVEHGLEMFFNPVPPSGPWAAVVHCDLWVNNTMVKFEDGKVVENKMVDFQILSHDSVGRDVLLFIFTSVQNAVILDHFDDLIDEYFGTFSATLEALNVDLAPYTREGLLEELGQCAITKGLSHCSFMLRPIFAESHDVQEVEDLNIDSLTNNVNVSNAYKEKLWLIVREFAKRDWLL